ncbi:SE1561 family protein [Bacillus marinisedimentorum]|uniref:SE1561 family protein n=1 Tax=Bacillus marinisedimentorum TaxID=1821260 RepID=UPI0008727B90|nr:SE1561 family protein [Bacillus marinisedimentorum]
MGKAVKDNESQLNYLKNRLELFMDVIDSLDPESTDVEDIDRLLEMLDNIQTKVDRFQKDKK